MIPVLSTLVRHFSDSSTDLKAILAEKIPKEQERVKTFRKEYGSKVVGEVTVDMVSIMYFCQHFAQYSRIYFNNFLLSNLLL